MTKGNKLGGRKRTRNQRERDLAILSELYVRGMPDFVCADIISKQYDFDLSPRTIRNDKNELRKRWITSQIINFDEAKARELELIDRMIEACWIGWDNSLKDEGFIEIQETEEDKLPGGESTKPIKIKAIKKLKREALRDGNHVWIEQMRKLSDQRAKLLGLYEAEKFQIDWQEQLSKSGMPDAAVTATIEEALRVVENAFDDSD